MRSRWSGFSVEELLKLQDVISNACEDDSLATDDDGNPIVDVSVLELFLNEIHAEMNCTIGSVM